MDMKCKFFFKKYVFLWLYWVLIAACGILVAACGIEFPDQDLNSGLPALGVQRLTTGSSGRSLKCKLLSPTQVLPNQKLWSLPGQALQVTQVYLGMESQGSRGVGELERWALWAWAEISTFISRIMGSFWKVLKHRYKTIRFMLFKKFHLKKDVWQHSCLENSMDRGAWHVVVHWSCRVGHNWATNSIHYLYKMGNIASIL